MFIGFRRLLYLLIVTRPPDDSQHVYTVRKVTNYLVNVLVALLILAMWMQHVGDLSVALGILGAGLVSALQEVVGSVASQTVAIVQFPS